MYDESEALTEREAQAIAREWVDNRIERPAKRHTFSQTRWVMNDLASICVAESLRHAERYDQLCARLATAWDIVHGIWYTSAPEVAKRILWSDDEKPEEEEQARIDAAQHVIWHRRDPRRSFEEGFVSVHYTSFDRGQLKSVIADYLEKPWLRHPFVDWVLIDMTISLNICALGEAIKQEIVPGKRDRFLKVHHKYYSTKGNLARMASMSWSELGERLEKWWLRFLWAVGVPIGAVWAAFYFGYSKTGSVILALYAFAIAVYLVVKIIGWSGKVVRRVLGRPDPRVKAFVLWDQMYEVWRRLDGPVINPTRVREAMVKSAEEHPVWDEATWSLIDRVVAIDSATWVVQPSRN